MTLEEYINKLGVTKTGIESNNGGKTMEKVASGALVLLRKRVTEKGVNAEGAKFPAYSTKPTLVGCKSFYKKSSCEALLGTKAKRAKLEWRTVKGQKLAILPGGYRKIRELQSYPTGYVNFTISGEMWRSINVESSQTQHQQGLAIIGAKGGESNKKLSGNTRRKGNILDLSRREQTELSKLFELETLNVFTFNGL